MSAIVVRPMAAAEIENACRWYESKKSGLGDAFLAEVEHALERVSQMPEIDAVLLRDTQRALLRRFPYSLLCRVGERHIIVVACFHAKRDLDEWQGRA